MMVPVQQSAIGKSIDDAVKVFVSSYSVPV